MESEKLTAPRHVYVVICATKNVSFCFKALGVLMNVARVTSEEIYKCSGRLEQFAAQIAHELHD